MNRKLTLSIDDNVINLAKDYAKQQGRSLSSVVEEYLKSLSTYRINREQVTEDPLIEELWGSVKNKTNFSEDELLQKALMDKYLRP